MMMTTPEPSPAEELRTAAATLRAAADAAQEASPTPWTPDDPMDPELRWSALMDPTVGAALADWLEHMARSCDSKVKAAAAVWDLNDPGQASEAERFVAKGPFGLTPALTVARSINSKEQP